MWQLQAAICQILQISVILFPLFYCLFVFPLSAHPAMKMHVVNIFQPFSFSKPIRNISKSFSKPNLTSNVQTMLPVPKMEANVREVCGFFFFSPSLFLFLLTLSVGGVNCLNPPRADGEIGKPTQLANWSLIPTVKK